MQTDHQTPPPFTRDSDSAFGALVRARQTVLTRASALLDPEQTLPLAEQYDALPAMTGLLMTSLEELKVAEEELREQNMELLKQSDARESVVEHYRQLFMCAPVPAFVTDIYGTIIEANVAASALFKRDAQRLPRKPFAAMLAQTGREEFRRQLNRIKPDRGVDDWRLTLHRTGDDPVNVRATVSFVPNIGATRTGVLYWMLRVENETPR